MKIKNFLKLLFCRHMTENEAIKELDLCMRTCAYLGCDGMAIYMAIEALRENQKYRAIGTVEEFKALKKKEMQR